MGCQEGHTIILSNTTTSPLRPVSSPSLVELIDSFASIQRGLFSVNLTDAVGDRNSTPEEGLLNGFLFKIHDLSTNNITYIWQVIMRQKS